MQKDILSKVSFLVGDTDTLENMSKRSYAPFSEEIIDFLDFISRWLRKDCEAKKFPDIQTFAIWARKSSLLKMKESYGGLSDRLGRGITFHVAPSNIPLMFMFSFAASLLAGNPNIIRLSSKEFKQTPILIHAIEEAIRNDQRMHDMTAVVRYGHEKEVTDYLSSMCRSRIIWGGDHSVNQIRKSELPVYAIDLPFYDRFSFAVIDSDAYLSCEEKSRLAERFYNDTYLTDQNACTSPQLVMWTGRQKGEARNRFWEELESFAGKKYSFQSIQAVDKLAAAARFGAAGLEGKMICKNMGLVRIELETLPKNLKDYRCPGGYFYEYLCDDLHEIKNVCGLECQTVSYFGLDREEIIQILQEEKCAGADRVVPIGATMNFGLQWDGFDFIYSLSRIVA